MCGIFGSVGAPLPPEAVANALAALKHRGPESNGAVQLEGAVLAHTRLRIIDLSPAGSQPMANEDQTVWVTFNGEIYNFQQLRRELEGLGHRFRSHSDTEVLVHGYEAWGDAVAERVDGMFAFGIWDSKTRRLLLARDRAGKKPLFYAQHQGRFLFASEIKGLFAAGVPIDIDPAGVVGYLAYGYVPPPGTAYRGVEQLLPAHRLVLEPGRPPETERYWHFNFQARQPFPAEEEAATQVRTLLTEAVRKRMVADVPVGAFLSGGLDSTIVVGLMSRLGHKVRTFSIGFEGDPRYDETHYARVAARAFGTEHTEFRVTPSDFELVEKLVWHHDGPFGDSSAIPTYVVSRLTREHVTVALNGDGGDELFAGYLRFLGAQVTELMPAPLRSLAARAAGLIPAGLPSRGAPARARRLLLALESPLGDRMARWTGFFAFSLDEALRPDLLPYAAGALAFHRQYFDPGPGGRSTLAQVLDHNFAAYLPYALLVKMDRTSMAHALETRSPFLDTALIDYVSGLPDRFKLRGRTTKYILRRAFADLLPPEIKARGKMGFGVPLATWFRGDLRSYLIDLIASPSSRINEYVRPDLVARMVSAHMDRRGDHEQQFWALLTLELWLRNLSKLARPWEATPEPVPIAKAG
jgi:asparagine synthase (glutamine-hydrolysing)